MSDMQPSSNAARAGIHRAAALSLALVAVFLALVAVAGLQAHHGSADYHTDREVVVSGTVKEFRWANPHVWVYLTVSKGSAMEEWNGEGPPLTWAQARGWSSATLKPGVRVRLVMYPSRSDARGGLIRRIERDGADALVVSRPWLDSR
jgi:hypothetical protein